MRYPDVAAIVIGLCTTLATSSARAETPKEAMGFWGTVTGTVKSAAADGLSFTFTVSKAEPDESKSIIKDGAPMVGKVLTLGTRMPKKDGKPYPNEEDIAYIKTLKPGMKLTIKIFAVKSAPTVLRIQGPGKETTDAAPAK